MNTDWPKFHPLETHPNLFWCIVNPLSWIRLAVWVIYLATLALALPNKLLNGVLFYHTNPHIGDRSEFRQIAKELQGQGPEQRTNL